MDGDLHESGTNDLLSCWPFGSFGEAHGHGLPNGAPDEMYAICGIHGQPSLGAAGCAQGGRGRAAVWRGFGYEVRRKAASRCVGGSHTRACAG